MASFYLFRLIISMVMILFIFLEFLKAFAAPFRVWLTGSLGASPSDE